jgi:hypothetical protein
MRSGINHERFEYERRGTAKSTDDGGCGAAGSSAPLRQTLTIVLRRNASQPPQGASDRPVAKPGALWHSFPLRRALRRLPSYGCGCSSGVEHNLAKVGVEGSNPFARSKNLLLHFFHKLETASAVVPGTQSAAGPPCVRRFYRTTPAPHTQWSSGAASEIRSSLARGSWHPLRSDPHFRAFNVVSRACDFIVSKLSQTTV